MTSHRSLKSSIYDREEKKMQYQSQIRGLNAYDRHNKFMRDYVQFYGKTSHTHDKLPIKTDQDTIREGYRFIISEDDDMESTWEKRLVNFSYLEAGYNKQALVKLVACKGENDKKDNDIDDEYDKNSNTTKKGRRTSASVTKERDADEDFEEFLEGIF
ncbi:Folate-sensitive fragile site protein Fra10Ac1 [Musa troglodytarum]|uniref:Folate-sensitive fragile site protein Fra10Ac1 n=1 Tax=Musa troglodytarum TaxID=320322 RepID=A0A9E7EUW6_9LILI|nr:Folate-sensitive fragile site protein Fra10Ac1 [Musa troglodytarum]